jgi:hypothetical protein
MNAGHLDREHWLKQRGEAGLRRFWAGEEERGHLRHGRHGWMLSFDKAEDGDEIIFKGDEHRFAEDEYVSIKERDGSTRTFRVTSVG